MSTRRSDVHACAICFKAFSRPEHLQRHRATHSGLKPFQCSQCGKSFSRKDATDRHEQSCPEGNEHAKRSTTMRRACLACSTARVSCPGGSPCANCEGKSLQCVYVQRKRRRMNAQRDQSPSAQLSERVQNDRCSVGTADSSSEIITPEKSNEDASAGFDSMDSLPNIDRTRLSVHLQPTDGSETALNWLPFDRSTPSDYLDETSWNVHPDPEGSTIFLGARNTSERLCHIYDQQPQTAPRREDSLATLIASMGRASRAFGRDHSLGSVFQNGYLTNHPGSLYSDGAGGRSSQAERAMQKRRSHLERSTSSSPTGDIYATRPGQSPLPTFETVIQGVQRSGDSQLYHIPEDVYNDIMAKVADRIPFHWPDTSPRLGNRSLPGKETLDHFVRLYFNHFHPVYPFLDLPLLNMPLWGWSLCLATAAVGSRYSNAAEKDRFGDAISIILRETLVSEVQFKGAELTLSCLQAFLLNTLMLSQSADSLVMALGEEALSPVMSSCVRLCLFDEPSGENEQSMRIQGDMNQMWTAWRCREMWRRTGLFAWVLDSSLSLTRITPPILSMQHLKFILPCAEKLWEADSSLEWYRACNPHTREPPDPGFFKSEEDGRLLFTTAIAQLYDRLELVDNISQFASIGCIYAFLQHHWDMIQHVETLFHEPISRNTDETGYKSALLPYVAADLQFTRWRNKACDCLDVLHWDALGNSAKAAGLEGPIFLHLHLSRLFLLTPVKELLVIAEERIPDRFYVQMPHNVAWRRVNLRLSRKVIKTWAHRDRYKARLAVIHAGASFWHVRRYATDSFVQPFVIYLAAIVIHFFAHLSIDRRTTPETNGTASSKTPILYEGNADNTNPAPTQSDTPDSIRSRPRPLRASRMPTHCYIDRPIDDELVQYFVRNGETKITPCVEAIDNLCSAAGARQILREAAALLEAETLVWPMARKYAMALEAMVQGGYDGEAV